jgi:ferredoxin
MMEAIRNMLAELGVPKDQVKFEMFGPPPSAKTGEDSAAEEGTEAAPSATGPAINFSLSGTSGQLQPGETVLEAAERMGVEIDSSCRAGSCGMCAVKLLEGQVDMANEDGLEPADKAQGMILACQAKARTDLTIEA